MDKIFICSPYRGDIKGNTETALGVARAVYILGYMPIAPHLYFTRFLNEDIEKERSFGISCGLELMKSCKEMWVIGPKLTEGMRTEIAEAIDIKLPVNFYILKDRILTPIGNIKNT